jgi:hypothetical protein
MQTVLIHNNEHVWFEPVLCVSHVDVDPAENSDLSRAHILLVDYIHDVFPNVLIHHVGYLSVGLLGCSNTVLVLPDDTFDVLHLHITA